MLAAIVAMSENYVIGRRNDLPWHLPRDLRRFKKLTMGHHIIMGRKTYDSIGRPLPGRTSVVITRDPGFEPTENGARDLIVVHSFAGALEQVAGDDESFVIGGESIFRLALPSVERLYVTLVHANVEGDVLFPRESVPGRSLDDWKLVSEESHAADERHRYPYSFRVYETPAAE